MMLRQRLRFSSLQSLLLLASYSTVFNLKALATEATAAATGNTGPSCGAESGFTVAGAVGVNRLLRAWAAAYPCSTEITVEDATSASGAAQVCGVRRDAPVVDVSSTTRSLNQLEAKSVDSWRFDCEMSTRSTVQVRMQADCVVPNHALSHPFLLL